MATTKSDSYECLFDQIELRSGMCMTFYEEGYSSFRKAEKAMERLHARVMREKAEGFKPCNFRIVKHEIVDTETVVKKYERWEEC